MKNWTYNLILLLLLGTASLHALEPSFKKEFTREVHETFEVSSGANLSIQNKYGDITIETWSKNQIQVDVLIKVNSSNTEKARNFLNEIIIDFSSSKSSVSVKTIYPDYKNSWWSGWLGNGKKMDYEVHYTINAPSDVSTSLINKYGNIIQASIGGNSDVINKYGNIFYEDISGDLNLNLGYGKASIGTVNGDCKVEINYSSLKILETKDLEISTKYSDIRIKRCRHVKSYTKYDKYKIESLISLKNDGKYDDFAIGEIEDINIDTKYTDISVGTLHQKAIFETGYGSVNVKSTSNNIEKIKVNSKYTHYDFNISGAFHLDFEGSRTDLHVSKPYERYDYNKDGGDLKLKAYRGSKEGGVNISVYMRYGGLDIN